MTTAQLVPIILSVGGLLPLLTAVVQQQRWSTRARTLVGVALSILAGLVTYVSTNGLDLSPARLVTTVLGIVLAASAAYAHVWKPLGVAPSVEAATTKSPAGGALGDPTAAEHIEETPDLDEVPVDTPADLEPPEGFDDGTGRSPSTLH